MSSIPEPAPEFKFHPLADIFPLMEGEEFDALVADIKANGLSEKIVLYEGMILDGRNRYRACLAAGEPPHFAKGDYYDPAAYVISADIHRRHLTAEQKRDLIAKLIKAEPEKSNNAIAKQAKVDDKTVAKVRHGMEARSEIPNVSTRTDTKGRKQPARKGWSRERYRRHRARKRGDDPEASAEAMKAKFAEAVASGLRVEQQRNSDLAEKLRAAEMKIAGLESEVADLKAERDRLRAEVAELQAVLETTTAISALKTEKLLEAKSKLPAGNDPRPIPECLRCDRVSS